MYLLYGLLKPFSRKKYIFFALFCIYFVLCALPSKQGNKQHPMLQAQLPIRPIEKQRKWP